MAPRVQSTLALLTNGMTLEELEQELVRLKEREDFSLFSDVCLELDYELGYYDDVSVSGAITGYRAETAEETELKKERSQKGKENEIARLERELAALKAKK